MTDRRLRIAMPYFNLAGKGTYWRAYGLASELTRRGHQVTMLGAGRSDKKSMQERKLSSQYQPIQINLTSLWEKTQGSGYDLGDFFGRLIWIYRQENNFDIVHAFESRPTTILPAKLLQRQGAIYISDWCDWFGKGGSVEQRTSVVSRSVMRPVETLFENRSRPGADGVTVINQKLYQKARALGIPGERILVLSNGAYIDDFVPKDRLAARSRLGLPPNDPIVAYTGTMFMADAKLMAETFDLIQSELAQAKLLLIGYTNIDVKALVKDPASVILTGSVSFHDLTDYVAACDIGWLPLANMPANSGRFPMKLNDFMSAGRAVVVTDVGEIGSVVRKHDIGLATESSAEKQAKAILHLLANPDKLDTYGDRARHAAEEVFVWSKITDDLEQFYVRLLEKPGLN